MSKSSLTIENEDCLHIDLSDKYVLSKTQIIELVAKMKEIKSKIDCPLKTLMFKNDIIDVVPYIQIVDFDKIAFSSRRRIVKEFLKDTFKNVSIKTKDNKIIKMFNSGANKISQSTTNNQQEIALFSKELIQVAEFEKTVQSSNNKRFKGLIHFYKSFIIFNDKLLKVNLNIREDASGLNLYDINKIAVIGDTSSESWAYIPANTNLNDY